MALQLTGLVEAVGPTQTIDTKSGKQLIKRSLYIDSTRYDQITGERMFENHPAIEFTGDRVSMLDAYKQGDAVIVYFDVQGTNYINEKGESANFTAIRGYKIEKRERVDRTSVQQHQDVPAQPAAPQGQLGQTYYQKEPAAKTAAPQQPPQQDKLPF